MQLPPRLRVGHPLLHPFFAPGSEIVFYFNPRACLPVLHLQHGPARASGQGTVACTPPFPPHDAA